KVDLKVSVNCCEGCKRKILKALSIKGVLKTEIHPTLPKITVTGNVEVQTLIKKLAKCGKSAVLWPSQPPVPKEKQESETTIHKMENANDKDNIESTERKSNSNSSTKKFQTKEHDEVDIQENKNIDEAPIIIREVEKNSYQTVVTNVPQVNCLVNPGAIPLYVQGYYPVPAPYYAMNMPCYVHDHCRCQYPANRPSFVQPQQTMGFAEYFNDDNTVGCNVM
ncbi:uncharacterized protein A4U43_C04F16040, partial [Asparagus officinalis]